MSIFGHKGTATFYTYRTSISRWYANYALQNHHLRPSRGYTPFRAHEMKWLRQQTTETRISSSSRYRSNVFAGGAPRIIATCENRLTVSDFQALVPYTTTKSFIHTLLNPNPTRHLTAEETLLYNGSRASLLRPNTTSRVCARTLTCPHAGAARSAWHVPGANNNKQD